MSLPFDPRLPEEVYKEDKPLKKRERPPLPIHSIFPRPPVMPPTAPLTGMLPNVPSVPFPTARPERRHVRFASQKLPEVVECPEVVKVQRVKRLRTEDDEPDQPDQPDQPERRLVRFSHMDLQNLVRREVCQQNDRITKDILNIYDNQAKIAHALRALEVKLNTSISNLEFSNSVQQSKIEVTRDVLLREIGSFKMELQKIDAKMEHAHKLLETKFAE